MHDAIDRKLILLPEIEGKFALRLCNFNIIRESDINSMFTFSVAIGARLVLSALVKKYIFKANSLKIDQLPYWLNLSSYETLLTSTSGFSLVGGLGGPSMSSVSPS